MNPPSGSRQTIDDLPSRESGERAFSVGADIKDRDDLLAVRDSEDGAEGRVAFREKRKPQFTGR
jgi:enoyl-CoA hydratase/carnithine racemase